MDWGMKVGDKQDDPYPLQTVINSWGQLHNRILKWTEQSLLLTL